jgi:hypothetical protein
MGATHKYAPIGWKTIPKTLSNVNAQVKLLMTSVCVVSVLLLV